MTTPDFISHTKHLVAVRKAAHGTIQQVPLKLFGALGELTKRHGLLRVLAILSSGKDVFGLKPIVKRNLLRRQIRFPKLYTNRIVGWFYCHLVLLRARLFAALLSDYFHAYPEARALVFNGFLMPDALTLAVAKSLGRERLVVELGFFPETLQYDVRGINYDSSLPRDADFYRRVGPELDLEKPKELVRRQTKQKGQSIAALPSAYVFVPMQVPSDMQILAHSPWVRDMVHFHEILSELADRHPEHQFVVKEHPSFPLSIRGRIRAHPRIHFANQNDTRELIQGADTVLTVNSTVGLEGLLLGKKVLTLGNAPYNVEGLVLHAKNHADLDAHLSILQDWQPDEILRDLFLRYVYTVFLLRGDRHNPTEAMIEALRLRAKRADLHHRYLSEHAASHGTGLPGSPEDRV